MSLLSNISLDHFTQNEEKEKYFPGLFENRTSKFAFLICSLILSLIDVILSWGIIWYEKFGSDNRRTLINKLVASICWRMIFWILMCQSLDIWRYSFGPLPIWICTLHVIAKSSMRVQFLFLFDAIQLTKYIFVFHLKNPSAVTEEFWSMFINVLIILLSYIFAFGIFFIDPRKQIQYYTCADLDMIPILGLPKSSNIQPEMLSLVMFTLIHSKIRWYKEKYDKGKNCEKNSLADNKMGFLGLGTFCLFTFLTIQVNSITPLDMNFFPNYLYMQIFQLLGPNLIGIQLFAVYYVRQPQLRSSLIQNMSELFRNNRIYHLNQ